jgi:hypothetical protein
VARLFPFRLKNLLIRTLYKVDAEDVLPTYHRFNTPAKFRNDSAPLQLLDLRLLQDVNYTRKSLFWFFFLGLLLTRKGWKIMRTNLLGVFKI